MVYFIYMYLLEHFLQPFGFSLLARYLIFTKKDDNTLLYRNNCILNGAEEYIKYKNAVTDSATRLTIKKL